MNDRLAKRAAWLFPLVFAIIVALVLAFETGANRSGYVIGPRSIIDTAFGVLSVVAALGTIAFSVLRARFSKLAARCSIAYVVVLAALCFGGGVTYFYGIRGLTSTVYLHTHDAFHYFIGPKYYAELDYDQLYECTIAAAPLVARKDTPVRDLATLKVAPLGKRRAEFVERCKPLFSAERWESFKRDVDVFFKVNRGGVRSAIGDLGYNGAPFHALVAGTAANAISSLAPLGDSVMLLPLLDVAGITLMLMLVTRAFGVRLALIAALFMFTAIVDRQAIIGNSFLRYMWLVTLVLGIVALKRERYATAGVWIALSASLNVFPMLFAVAIPIKALVDVVRRRGLSQRYKRFMVAGLCTGAICFVLGASHARHLGNYEGFLADMRQHDVQGRTPGFGVGLKFDMIYLHRHLHPGVRADKQTRLHEMKPVILGTAALLIGLLIALVPKLDDIEASVLLGFALVFCLFGPTAYYYSFALLLVLAWDARRGTTAAAAFIAALFAINAFAYAVLLKMQDLFYVLNVTVSILWTVYLIAVLIYLAFATGTVRWPRRDRVSQSSTTLSTDPTTLSETPR